ncbi:MAG: hypothetical protein G01um10142_534 [Parcubacteria group bacterium Gr01-1014_2]|nr:MAG: hypothetical protein G01um10142_534 [Parcubacteria group bacterium Gr01-1014_2]
MFSRKDLIFSLITGFYAGFIAWRILDFLNTPLLKGISFAWLMVWVPVLWILGVNLGYFLGKWFIFFNQFGKFAAIGFTNAAVDFGVLNLLIFYSGITSGILFPVFKGISFFFGTIHSYFWNKYWAFSAEGGSLPVGRRGASGEKANKISGQEFSKFFAITFIAILINVTAASIVVNFIGPQFGLTSEAWANVGAVIGSAVALVVSFIGFKVAVFKK